MHFCRIALSLTGGGIIGWVAHVESTKRTTVLNVNDNIESGTYRPKPWNDNWDKRTPSSLLNYRILAKNNGGKENISEEAELKKCTPTATRHLICIRHGQYNFEGKTDEERTLTELGQHQADETGKRLLEIGLQYNVLVNSSMTRARETAGIIHKHLKELPTVQCDLLREGACFPSEPPLRSWKPEHKYYEDNARIEAAFRKYFHRADVKQTEDSYEIIVCHANVIRYFACRALQLPPEAWLRISLYNASVTMFTISPNGFVCMSSLGEAGHLPKEMLTVT